MHISGRAGHLCSTIVREGSNAYWFTVIMQNDGDWVRSASKCGIIPRVTSMIGGQDTAS